MGVLETYLAGYSIGTLSGIALLAILAFGIVSVLYTVYLHPLAKYPGPWLASATRLWYVWHSTRGDLLYAVHAAHQKYGEIIRIAPDELSYTSPEAWNDIYGHRIGKAELMKDPVFYSSLSAGPGSIINADRIRHGFLRKQASHGFSEAALRSQEEVIKEYADLMISRLEDSVAQGKQTVDIVSWFNFFTFDIMGVLVFGQSFECLENWGYHPWVSLIFDSVKAGGYVRASKYWPTLTPLVRRFLLPKDLGKRRAEQQRMAKEKAAFRKSIDDDRQDLISGYLKKDSGVSYQEYEATVQTMIIAGSETTATLMSGLVFYLMKDPERLTKLKTEIRSTILTDDDVTFTNVNQLPYLLACLNEALRIYPPVPETFPRNTGPNEEVICGQVVPPRTILGMNHWSTYHSPRYFTRPDEFIPERWLENSPEFENDRKEALQAFHVGPRNCLGRNLAYFEMRLLIVLLLRHFDLELDAGSERWNEQKAYLLWEKPAMNVKLVPVLSKS